ncbi:MAG: NfeD family protein [Oscillatoria sp. PMC 1068.18]|nr:NfeD family protein [Oscillatoria sp. PMC 1068.18]
MYIPMSEVASTDVEMFAEPSLGSVEIAIAHDQPGRAKFRASYWPAKLYQTTPDLIPTLLQPGQPVTVVGREGIVLLVVPA